MRVALDTNVLAYAEGIGDQTRLDVSLTLLSQLPQELILLPAQILGELYRVLTGKAHWGHSAAREAILNWGDSFEVVDSTWVAFQSAMDLSADHSLQIWDALILSVAAENRCRLLLSEDMQNGFTWRGVTVINPYTPTPHPLFLAAIQSS
ncbi:PIN domain-containing protein [Nitrosococcus wardiae]|uniref:PIN domain-containing protein n=1 Tax=Nitrosococcus wardiae TaxID=1814290 RepID=A0A4V1AWA5_9GAMM|nr:PIN domain-containing protein [Nitrosococcus wardiae]QBQ55955.1 PIN domain-containing protein [Nitrosococcus wardiae]